MTARRPVIREDLRAGIDRVLQSIQAEELRAALKPGENPFSYEKLVYRYAYKVEKQATDQPAKPAQPARPPHLSNGV